MDDIREIDIIRILSAARFAPYQRHTPDLTDAIAAYEENLLFCTRYFVAVHFLEVALRNEINGILRLRTHKLRGASLAQNRQLAMDYRDFAPDPSGDIFASSRWLFTLGNSFGYSLRAKSQRYFAKMPLASTPFMGPEPNNSIGPGWFLREDALNTPHDRQLEDARDRLKKQGKRAPSPDDMVAKLPLGFWVGILRADYEKKQQYWRK